MKFILVILFMFSIFGMMLAEDGLEKRVVIDKSMLTNEVKGGDAWILFDEQEKLGKTAPPMGMKVLSLKAWNGPKRTVLNSYIDLGKKREISSIWLYDSSGGKVDFIVSHGKPGAWKVLFTDNCVGYEVWKIHQARVKTRYLRFTKTHGNANIAEIAIFETPGAGFTSVPQIKKVTIPWEIKPEPFADADTVKKAITSRKLVDAGKPFGKLPLIDEVLCGDPVSSAKHEFRESPEGASRIGKILGKTCRLLPGTGKQKHISFRMGKNAGLEGGKCYLLTIDYPEDKPRTMFIANMGNESVRGFHTGNTVGDIFFTHSINNLESMKIPMSRKYKTWKQFFFLHDRYPKIKRLRDERTRVLVPGNGFNVIICQSRGINAPESAGAAVFRIRLFEVPNPEKFNAVSSLPEGLPKRRLFYRQEMAMVVINHNKKMMRGVNKVEDWYEQKMRLMKFLGMNTYSKPLLVFGNAQGWDAGDNNWFVAHKFPWLWRRLLVLATKYNLDVLPYYEYGGSSGPKGLGRRKLAKPLTLDKNYTNIIWSEKFNADITHPDTLKDIKKLLRCTILRHKDIANFAGAWFRPRVSQMPISFSKNALEMFARDTNKNYALKREMLKGKQNKKLLDEYYVWWYKKQKDFFLAITDYLRKGGIKNADLLFTPYVSEPGVPLTDFKPGKRILMVTDNTEFWDKVFSKRPYGSNKSGVWNWAAISYKTVLAKNLYLRSLLAPRWTWGDWEWHHACTRPNPAIYKDSKGVMITYPFNRLYTTAPKKPLKSLI